HPADHVVEQLGVQDDVAGLEDVGFDGGDDAQLHVIAGEGEVDTFGFQQNALQGGGGGAGRYGAGDAVDGGAQKGFVADDVQFRFSPFLLAWTCGVPV